MAMKLAYHCWTSMKSDLTTDIQAAARAGFRALELGASKITRFLQDSSIEELKKLLEQHGLTPIAINSLEFIAFRGETYPEIQEECRQLSQWCQDLGCSTINAVASPLPDWKTSWPAVVNEYV